MNREPSVPERIAQHLARITTEYQALAVALVEAAATPPALPETAATGPEPMWTPQQVAEAWNVNHETVLDWIGDESLGAVKVGQRYKIPDSECRRFQRERLRGGAAALRAA